MRADILRFGHRAKRGKVRILGYSRPNYKKKATKWLTSILKIIGGKAKKIFINAFLSVVGGKSYLEANTALGRTDLLINVRGFEQVVEAKVFKNITQFEDGKAQLAYYAQHLALKTAYYLVFTDTEVTHSNVLEADEIIESIRIKTYLVRYELDKDFTLPRKKKLKK